MKFNVTYESMCSLRILSCDFFEKVYKFHGFILKIIIYKIYFVKFENNHQDFELKSLFFFSGILSFELFYRKMCLT